MGILIKITMLLSTTDPRCRAFFSPCKRNEIHPEFSTGKQRSQIPQVYSGGYSHGRHAQHQEHVGERQRVQLTWKWWEHVQGKRRGGGGWEKVNETLCVWVMRAEREREERAQFTGTSCLAPFTMTTRLSWPLTLSKQEAAVMKTGVAGRINDWLNKTPESGKTSGGRPAVGRHRSNPSLLPGSTVHVLYSSRPCREMLKKNCYRADAVGFIDLFV